MSPRNLIWFFLLFAHSVFGQTPVWKSIDSEITKNFSAVGVDSLGFLWALAEDGLYKYDGYQLSLVLPSQDPEISFSSLDQSASHEIIIGTSKGSLIFFNPYNGKVETKKWINEEITYINCPNRDARCLVVSYGNGCRIIKGSFDNWVSADSLLVSNEVYAGAYIKNELWLATDQGIQQFTFLNKGLKSQVLDQNSGLSDIITTNIEVTGQNLWIANFEKGVEEIIQNRTLKFYPLPNPSKIHQIKYWKNKLFVATEEGLLILEKGQWRKIYPEVGNEKVQAFEIDQKSNLWLIGKNGKLYGASLLFEKMETQFSQIQALHRFNNQLYVGTKEGLYRKEETSWKKILSTNITAIQSINNDLLWVGTYTVGAGSSVPAGTSFFFSFSIYSDGTASYKSKGFYNGSYDYITFANGTWTLTGTQFSFTVTTINLAGGGPQQPQSGAATFNTSAGTLTNGTFVGNSATWTMTKVN